MENVRFTSFKVDVDIDTVLRVTALICNSPNSPDRVRVSFGYQSLKDNDWRTAGKTAATNAMDTYRFISIPRAHANSTKNLLILALAMSVAYPKGIKWVSAIIGEIGDQWLKENTKGKGGTCGV